MPTIVIAAYSCEVAGEPTDSVDYQVRYFESGDVDEISRRLHEESVTYKNSDGQDVRWVFDETIAVEANPRFEDGSELIGFITGKPKNVAK